MLAQHQIMYRGEVVAGEILFVMGNTEMRTHHIHVVKWKDTLWNPYINFRDYLNAFPEKAKLYDTCKQNLAKQFTHNRKNYTAGKEETIQRLLAEASTWKANLLKTGNYK